MKAFSFRSHFLFFILFHFSFSTDSFLDGESDLIGHLPGLNCTSDPSSYPKLPPCPFNQYAGLISLPSGNSLFYWYLEALKEDPNRPLVMWLNGGPGCSSLEGLLIENGPFRPTENGLEDTSEYSWFQFADMLYLESPAGVGFSNSAPGLNYSDDSTMAADSLQFLLRWFEKFPKNQGRDFWITGESYAGHYIPTIVEAILASKVSINLKGFAIGNPSTEFTIDVYSGTFRTYFYLGLISAPTYHEIEQNCASVTNWLDPPPSCMKWINQCQFEIGNIDPYDIDEPVCLSGLPTKRVHLLLPPPYRPCAPQLMGEYLNRADVQSALHIPTPKKWIQCNDYIGYNITQFLNSMLPLYENFFIQTNLSIMIFSGTADTVVPYLGTQLWVNELNTKMYGKPVEPWRPWLVEKQVAGYVTKYPRMTFVTVTGAGHMVSETKPPQAFHMMQSFLFGKAF